MNLSRFENLTKEEKKNLSLSDFTVSEIKYIIEETVFAKEIDIEIALLRFTKNMAQEKIAERIGYGKNTVCLRLNDIRKRLKETIDKLV